jgi:AbrB family looped-hinge helix DNA binding protein
VPAELQERILGANENLPYRLAYAILVAMDIHMDKLGRIVVPKRLRDRFGLRPDTPLELREHADGFSLRVPQLRPAMVSLNGLWVHQGTPPAGLNWDEAVDATRQERHLTLDRL